MRAPERVPRDVEIARAIAGWFADSARDLPWRRPAPEGSGFRRDPYRVLVSEFMLQQTQVARVLERYGPFLEAFPTVERLARADEAAVLAAWSGLGYYRRARLLHSAARCVAGDHGGRIPAEVTVLGELPGVGRYTAGAVACFAYGASVPIVDGNIARVLFRVMGRPAVQGAAADMRWAWEVAGAVVAATARDVASPLLNEGLMELGATVCVPGEPRCGVCPLAGVCVGRATGTASNIPTPRKAAAKRAVFCATVLIVDRRGRVLLEQRPATGMWSGMWQAPTLERAGARRHASAAAVASWLGVSEAGLSRLTRFRHETSHRSVHFECWRARADARPARRVSAGRRWVARSELAGLGLSSPQSRMLAVAWTPAGGVMGRHGSRPRTLPR